MLSNMSIAAKLGVAYCLFLAPIGYLGYRVMAANEATIAFTAKEVVGVHYISEVRSVQDQVAQGGDMASLAERIRLNEHALGGDLNTAKSADMLLKALNGTDRGAAAQAAADLISKSADGSNLTLDPDLDSYYTQDALTVKVPTVIADITALAALVAGTAGHDVSVDDRVAIGVQIGATQPALDALGSDIAIAVTGNPDNTVDGAVTPLVSKMNKAAWGIFTSLANHAKAGEAQAIARPLLEAVSAVGAADAGEVEHLLNARIDRLRWAEQIDGIVAVALFVAAVAYVLTIIQRGVIKSLRSLTATMRKLAAHDLTVEIDDSDRGDEVGGMARAVIVFKEQMVERRRLDAEAVSVRAEQERQQAALARHNQDFSESITGVLGTLGTSATSLHAAARDMSDAVEKTQSGTAKTALGAEQNASRLSGVAAATEQLTASVDEIARQVTHAAEVARSSVEQASVTRETVRGLSDAVGQIGDIVRLISDIAGQTNLLALNATIEAARAGDAGKGFAVVASEVKLLATQTHSATEQIGAQISAIRAAAESAVGAVQGVGDAIMRMDEVTSTIAAAVQEQGAATREIAANVQAVSFQNDECARSMNEVAGVADGARQAGVNVLSAGDEIGRVSEALRQEVEHFFAALRAEEGERRHWVRISANRAPVTLKNAKGRSIAGELIDISRGGAVVECDDALGVGAELEVQLPGVGGTVAGRVLRASGRSYVLLFRQDPASITCIDAAMHAIKSESAAPQSALTLAA